MTSLQWKFTLIDSIIANCQCCAISSDATKMFALGTNSDGYVALVMSNNKGINWQTITPDNISPVISSNNYGLACDPTGTFIIFSSETSIYATNVDNTSITFNRYFVGDYVGGVAIQTPQNSQISPYMYVNVRSSASEPIFKNYILASTDLFKTAFLALEPITQVDYIQGGQIGYIATPYTKTSLFITNYVTTFNIYPNLSSSPISSINTDFPALINTDTAGLNSILAVQSNPASVSISSDLGGTYVLVPIILPQGISPVIAVSNDGNFMLTCSQTQGVPPIEGEETYTEIYIQNSLNFDGVTPVFTNTNSNYFPWTCCSISDGDTEVASGILPIILAGTNGKGVYVGNLVTS